MIVSRSLQAVGIRIPKTACKAVTKGLRQLSSSQNGVLVIQPAEGSFWRSRTVPEEYSNYHVFACVRNPYSRIVSHFLHRKLKRTAGTMHRMMRNWTFRDYVEWNMDATSQPGLQHDTTQLWYLEGQRVDTILRFEELPTAFNTLPFVPVDFRLPVVNAAARKYAWRDFYDGDLARRVYEWMQDDFRAFGYREDCWMSSSLAEFDGKTALTFNSDPCHE